MRYRTVHAHYRHLQALEALVCSVEQAPSLASGRRAVTDDIELPGALRYLSRLCRAIHGALDIVRGLEPARFVAVPSRCAILPLRWDPVKPRDVA